MDAFPQKAIYISRLHSITAAVVWVCSQYIDSLYVDCLYINCLYCVVVENLCRLLSALCVYLARAALPRCALDSFPRSCQFHLCIFISTPQSVPHSNVTHNKTTAYQQVNHSPQVNSASTELHIFGVPHRKLLYCTGLACCCTYDYCAYTQSACSWLSCPIVQPSPRYCHSPDFGRRAHAPPPPELSLELDLFPQVRLTRGTYHASRNPNKRESLVRALAHASMERTCPPVHE